MVMTASAGKNLSTVLDGVGLARAGQALDRNGYRVVKDAARDSQVGELGVAVLACEATPHPHVTHQLGKNVLVSDP